MKLNLGCGHDHLEGWINVDVVEQVKPDVLLDLRQEWHWANDTVHEVLLKDILEHFTWEDLQWVMSELSRVTALGAVVTVRVPNIDQITRQFAKDPVVRNLFLYGDTHETGVFGAHKVGFTPELLTTLFVYYGFELVSIESLTTNWVGVFRRTKNMQLKKVGWCIQSGSWGGAEVYLNELIGALGENYSITQTVFSNNSQLRSKLSNQNVCVCALGAYADFVANWKALVKSLVFFPYTIFRYGVLAWHFGKKDVVVCATFSDKFFLTPWLAFFGVPVVWNEFGPVQPLLSKWFRVPEFLYRTMVQLADRVIVSSTHTKKSLSQKTHVSLAKLAKVACARDERLIAQEKKKGVGSDSSRSKTIVCVSRFEKGKGQDVLVEAFAQVVRREPEARLVLVGEGETLQAVQEQIKKLGISRYVTCKGFVEQVVPEVQAARMCVFPSQWHLEGFGLVAIEAMALGKPIIAFNVAPMNEITLHTETGLLVEPTVKNGLAHAMLRLLQDDILVDKIRKKSCEIFKEKYDIHRAAKEYYNQLLWAVSSKKARNQIRDVCK
jgi:glycosyltransferase involved in cell wall biosynthesis